MRLPQTFLTSMRTASCCARNDLPDNMQIAAKQDKHQEDRPAEVCYQTGKQLLVRVDLLRRTGDREVVGSVARWLVVGSWSDVSFKHLIANISKCGPSSASSCE